MKINCMFLRWVQVLLLKLFSHTVFPFVVELPLKRLCSEMSFEQNGNS